MTCKCDKTDFRWLPRYKNSETGEYLTPQEGIDLERQMREAGFKSLSHVKEVEGGFELNPWYWKYSRNIMPSKFCANCGESVHLLKELIT